MPHWLQEKNGVPNGETLGSRLFRMASWLTLIMVRFRCDTRASADTWAYI
jgi:hypothetical protein